MNRALLSNIGVVLGALIQGLAMSIFLFPHNIPSGGAAGLAILANHFFQMPLGFALWLSNAVFLVFALNYFGFTWTLKTIISVATTSLIVSLISGQVIIPHIHILVDIIAGGILFGIGVGILIRCGSSSGGMVIPALMIAKFRRWNPGKVMFGINISIFLITSIVIDYKIVIFAVICQLISSNIIDYIYYLQIREMKIFSPAWRKK